MRFPIPTALLVALLAAVARAEDVAASGGAAPVDDYRWAVYTSCSVVFISMAVYLILTHRNGARLDDEIAHLEGRINDLEK